LRASILMSLLVGLGGCGGLSMEQANAGAKPNTGFMVKQVRVGNEDLNFGLFIPHAYNSSARWPVIVFLHGALEGGNDGKSCMDVGLGPAVAKRAHDFPFIVIFPQTSDHWKGETGAQIVLACLDKVQHDYSTDVERVILSGLSDGGYGTWMVGARYPNRFSALVPMAGYSDYPDVARLTMLPVWCFHNSVDPFVSSGDSREMCKRIKDAGGNLKYTEYGTFGHDCWDQAYDQGELFTWMLAQHRGGDAPR
jgi:predicted peptidase